MQYFQRNGSYLLRRKPFVELPFHSLKHQASFEWTPGNKTQEQQRRFVQQQQEQDSVRNSYDQKIEQKLRQKYLTPVDTFRVIPNQITRKKDQEALSKQIEQFNNSKLTPNTNPEQSEHPDPGEQHPEHPDSPLAPSHQSAGELQQKRRPDSKYRMPYPEMEASQSRMRLHQKLMNRDYQGQYYSPLNQSNYYPQNTQERETMGNYRSPYLLKSRGPNSLPKFRKYANLSNSIDLKPLDNPLLPVRNYLPDQLEGFLRENLRNEERKRPFKASLSMGKRQGV